MCDIMILPKGVNIPLDKLSNVVNNNPHGFGLILKDKEHKKLDVIRRFNPKGTDPKEIEDLLNDNKDLERYLHVRWRTDGDFGIDNVHPFPAYFSNSRQVYFMHNGYLPDFKPKAERSTQVNNIKQVIEEAEKASDSKKFNDEFLSPLLLRTQGAIDDDFVGQLIHKYWNSSVSTGLLISNDLDPVLINRDKWKEMNFGQGKFYSSNDTYFDKLIRGPVFEEEKRKKEEEARRNAVSRFPHNQNTTTNYSRAGITDLKDIDLKPKEILTEDLVNILEHYELTSDKGLSALEQLTHIEIEHMVEKSPSAAIALIIQLTYAFNDLYMRNQRLVAYMKELKATGKSNIQIKDILGEKK